MKIKPQKPCLIFLAFLILSCNQAQLRKKRRELDSQKRQLNLQKFALDSSTEGRVESELYPLIVNDENGKHKGIYDSLMKIQARELNELKKIDSQLAIVNKQIDSLMK